MKKTLLFVICGIALGTLALLQCGNNNLLAGGSGLGNPTTPVAIAVVADTTPSVAKGAVEAVSATPAPSAKVKKNLKIQDAGGLAYTVDSVMMTVQRISFVPKHPESLATIELAPGLIKAGNAIVVEGPFFFDALRGTVTPALDHVPLPQIEYSAVMFMIDKKDPFGNETSGLMVGGSFYDKNATHGFTFSLICGIEVSYRGTNGVGFTVSGSDTLNLQIALDASHWLDSVDFAKCLTKKGIDFDASGDLLLNDSTPQSCVKVNQIMRSITGSGVVKIKKK
jgi:hypothetical protein